MHPGARLSGSGTPSIASDTFVLTGTGMPNGPALYFQGTARQNGGIGTIFGDGLLCVGGSLTRLGIKTNAGGSSQYPAVGDPSLHVQGSNVAGDTRQYQCWYGDSATFCVPATFNLSNGLETIWGP